MKFGELEIIPVSNGFIVKPRNREDGSFTDFKIFMVFNNSYELSKFVDRYYENMKLIDISMNEMDKKND